MNLIGKIFVVLILVMSIVFMSLAVAVYATHKNWREYVLNKEKGPGREPGVQWQLADEKDKNKKLEEEKLNLKTETDKQIDAKDKAIADLKNEIAVAKEKREQLEKDLTKIDTERRDSVAANQATQDINVNLRKEIEGLREEIRVAQKDRDETFRKFVELTDDGHQKAHELIVLKKRLTELTADFVKAKKVLEIKGLIAEPDAYAKEPPPGIDGIVLAVEAPNLIQISLGSDDFLRNGHVLYAYRQNGHQNIYLGKVEVVKTEQETAVCKIDPATRKAVIQKGDRVASRIPE